MSSTMILPSTIFSAGGKHYQDLRDKKMTANSSAQVLKLLTNENACLFQFCIPSNSVDWATAVVGEADRDLTWVTLTYHSSGPI